MKISTTTALLFPVCDHFKDGMRFLHRYGFEAADYFLHFGFYYLGKDWPGVIEKTASEARALGIEVFQTHLPFYDFARGYNPEWEQAVRDSILVTSMLGAKYAVLHPAQRHGAEDDPFAATVEYFKRHIDYASSKNVELLVENLPNANYGGARQAYCANAADLCEVADALGIGICWDFGHPQLNRFCMDQRDELRLVGKRLKAVHINDNFATTADEHIPPYLGLVNWDELLPVLKEIGFAGTLNFEVLPKRVRPEFMEELVRYLIRTAHHMKALIEA